MVNLATLTGACIVGLGTNYCGLFSDDDSWADELLGAAQDAGEKLWRLPLDEGLASSLKSKRADLRNIGGAWGGAITAALACGAVGSSSDQSLWRESQPAYAVKRGPECGKTFTSATLTST